MNIFIDIETLPSKELPNPDFIKVPGTYKDPIKIAEYQQNAVAEVHAKTALDALEGGRLLCIGFAINNDTPDIIYDGTPNEERVITAFNYMLLNDVGVRNYYAAKFVGHNLEFDLKWLWQLGHKYRQPFVKLFPESAKSHRVIDTMKLFTFNGYKEYVSLNQLYKFLFGKDAKSDMDGSKVYQTWLDGDNEKIQEYCKKDVRLVQTIFNNFIDFKIDDKIVEQIKTIE